MIKKLKNPKVRIFSLSLAAILVLLLIAVLFRNLFSNSQWGVEQQFNLLLAMIFLILSISALLVIRALKHWGYSQKPWVTLFAAYGLPLLAIVITYIWLQIEQAPVMEGRLVDSFFKATWQPLFYFWQVMILLFSLQFLFPRNTDNRPFLPKHAAIGILTGLGCGLVSVFIISVISNLPVNQSNAITTATPPSFLRWMTTILALTLAPFVIEKFFRQMLLQTWQIRFGAVRGFWFTALAFSLLTFQPVLLLPALGSALLFSVLIETQPFGTVVIAHALTNAMILLIGWQWVF